MINAGPDKQQQPGAIHGARRWLTLPAGVFLAMLTALLATAGQAAMEAMDDSEMGEVTGTGAIFVSDETQGATGFPDIDYFKTALDVEMDINTNIDKLQLGCGGVKGQGCDIDIDNFALSGQPGFGEQRAATSATLTRPFLEFAIKNPDSPTLREVVGFRVSAENMEGLLTAGQNTATANGINRLSGYLPVASTSGTATTIGSSTPGANPDQYTFGDDADEQVNTLADINVSACTQGCGSGRELYSLPGQSEGLELPEVEAPFTVPSFVVQGSRLEEATVSANATLPNVPVDSSMGSLQMELETSACVLYAFCVQQTSLTLLDPTSLEGLNVDISFTEDLGFIHKIPVNSPFSLSFQKEDFRWPGNTEVAEQGWWMSFQDQIDLGELNPANRIDISGDFDNVAVALGDALAEPGNRVTVGTEDGLQALFTGGIEKSLGPVDLSNQTVQLNISDIQLDSSQNVPSNCFGGAQFC